jgi:hypothetical protein
MLNSANCFPDDMEIVLDKKVDTQQHGTCQRVLDRHNSITRIATQYRIKNLLETGARKQLGIRPQ